jgi:cell division protein YceG involved in septum cleavage
MTGSDWSDPLAEDEAERERERRRAEREARRVKRTGRSQDSRDAIGGRVKDFLTGDAPPPPPPPPAGSPPAGPPPPPRPPSAPKDAYWRRRLLAVGALVAAVVIVVLVGVAIHHLTTNDGKATVTTQAKPAKTITIPEGYDRREVAAIADQAGLRGDYLKASQSFKGFDPGKYGAQSPQSLEGFLFPATYELPRHPTDDELVARQLAAFKQNISQVDMRYARSKNLTTYDVLIIGSMIEREVQVPKERKLVAAVVYNRLHAGMPLQIDATIRYATGNFTKPISPSELQVGSPYNTYTNSGLPPGPIGNPGLASIEAAALPAHVPYLYYVVKPNTCGQHTFATTAAEFNRAKAAYDQARAENGGNAPTPAHCAG